MASETMAGAKVADDQAVRTRVPVDVICRLAAAAAGHILAHDGRVARYIFLQEWHERSNPQISRAAGIAALNYGNGFTLEE